MYLCCSSTYCNHYPIGGWVRPCSAKSRAYVPKGIDSAAAARAEDDGDVEGEAQATTTGDIKQRWADGLLWTYIRPAMTHTINVSVASPSSSLFASIAPTVPTMMKPSTNIVYFHKR